MFGNTIRASFSYVAASLAAGLLSLAFAASCGPHSYMLKQNKAPWSVQPSQRTSPPVDAFALVYVEIFARPGECLPPVDKCESIIKELPIINQRRTGSGLNLWHEGKHYIITAAHVCTEDIPDILEHADVKFTIEQTIEIEVHSTSGRSLPAKVVALNHDEDLCALQTSEVFSEPIRLADKPPELGDKVYAVAAPYGLAGTNLALVFNGFYSGTRGGRHFYTIPTRPGSSGAIVLNSDWEAVGSLHTAYVPLENVGIGVGWQGLKTFLEGLN